MGGGEADVWSEARQLRLVEAAKTSVVISEGTVSTTVTSSSSFTAHCSLTSFECTLLRNNEQQQHQQAETAAESNTAGKAEKHQTSSNRLTITATRQPNKDQQHKSQAYTPPLLLLATSVPLLVVCHVSSHSHLHLHSLLPLHSKDGQAATPVGSTVPHQQRMERAGRSQANSQQSKRAATAVRSLCTYLHTMDHTCLRQRWQHLRPHVSHTTQHSTTAIAADRAVGEWASKAATSETMCSHKSHSQNNTTHLTHISTLPTPPPTNQPTSLPPLSLPLQAHHPLPPTTPQKPHHLSTTPPP